MQEQDESLILHLEALRTMLIKCFVALGVGLLPMFLAAPYGMNGLIKIIIGNNNVSLNYFSPMEVFILQIKIAVVLDLLICFPYIARQIWKFLLPALYDNERRFIKSIVFASSGLFIIGVLFCIFFILPLHAVMPPIQPAAMAPIHAKLLRSPNSFAVNQKFLNSGDIKNMTSMKMKSVLYLLHIRQTKGNAM